MTTRRYKAVFVFITISLISLTLGATWPQTQQATHHKTVRLIHFTGAVPPETTIGPAENDLIEGVKYAQAVERQQVLDYLDSLPKPQPVITRQSPITVSNNGAHSDAWWMAVSVCEQGGRNDSFFGYFSIMDGSAGGLDWSTQVAMANAIISRAGDGAWAASCVAAGYAASPSG